MKKLFQLITIVAVVGLLSGCETVIKTTLETGPTQLSVDGWLTNQPGPQRIRLTLTSNYFSTGAAPIASGATVTVTDNTGKVYPFTDPDNDGYYVWTPTPKDTLGRIGRTYQLTINYGNDTYTAKSQLNRVPPVDSMVFRQKKLSPFSKTMGYQAEFYAQDPAGATDYFRIKYYRNGELQEKVKDLISLKDASLFASSGSTDGLEFIRPVRRAINPDSLYVLNDVVKVEVLSVTEDAYNFLQQVNRQLSNVGLFATPAVNVPTNIIGTNGKPATGFFVTCAVSSRTAVVTPENLRPDN